MTSKAAGSLKRSAAMCAVLIAVIALASWTAGLSGEGTFTLVALGLVPVVPLSRMFDPAFKARQRYLRRRRPLAGPKPGARLG